MSRNKSYQSNLTQGRIAAEHLSIVFAVGAKVHPILYTVPWPHASLNRLIRFCRAHRCVHRRDTQPTGRTTCLEKFRHSTSTVASVVNFVQPTTVSRLSRWASTFVCNTVGVTCSTATVGLHTFARCKFLATKTCANLSLLQFPLLERDSRDILHQPSSNLDSDRQVDRQTNHLRYPLVCKSVTAHSVTTTVKKWAKTRECRMRRRERKCAENYNK